MAVKIKLKRLGKIRTPQYRIVVADSRTKRDGRAIEEIGIYHPMEEPSLIKIDSDRAQYWLSVGAQPTEAVTALFKVTGDWQKFKGLPGAEGTLRVAEVKPSRASVFEAAAKEAANEPKVAPKPKREEALTAAESAVVAEVVADEVTEASTGEEIAEAVAEAEVVVEAAEIVEAEEAVEAAEAETAAEPEA